jgi:hypothetical protein
MERLLKDVLICPPLGSSQRAKSDVCAVINFERQRNKFLVGWAANRSTACGMRP